MNRRFNAYMARKGHLGSIKLDKENQSLSIKVCIVWVEKKGSFDSKINFVDIWGMGTGLGMELGAERCSAGRAGAKLTPRLRVHSRAREPGAALRQQLPLSAPQDRSQTNPPPHTRHH